MKAARILATLAGCFAFGAVIGAALWIAYVCGWGRRQWQ